MNLYQKVRLCTDILLLTNIYKDDLVGYVASILICNNPVGDPVALAQGAHSVPNYWAQVHRVPRELIMHIY
jgi:hypothetical protein